MLKRPDKNPDRFKRHRQRVKAGIACALIEYDAVVVDFLVRVQWLDEREVCDRRAISAALSRMVQDAARR